jgi:DNA-binding response OmpR family regulator
VSSSRSVLPPEPADEHVVRARAQDRTWSAMVGALLLVADPEGGAGSPLDVELHAAGLSTVWCRDGAQALVEYGRRRPDAVLAAPRLEVVATPTVVHTLRNAGCRTVLVGVGPHDVDVAGPALVAGASGIVARPYVAGEIAQRLEPELHDLEHRVRLVYGPLELDPWAYRVRAGGVVIENLPLKEFELLRCLMAHADHVVTPEQIKAALWGEGASGPSSNAITVHVGRLRHRLEGVAEIRTVRGRGYRLTV